jgi:hypothetical protein
MHAFIRLLKTRKLQGPVSLCLLAFAFLFVSGVQVAWSDEPVGKVESLTGKASIQREGKTLHLAPGDPIYLRDVAKTAANSTLQFVFLDESRVKMAEDTVMEITEYLYSPQDKTRTSLLSMMSGRARFVVSGLQDYRDKRFRVQTQTAVVGTRDTDFIVGAKTDTGCPEGGLVEAFCVANAIVAYNKAFPDDQVILTANMVSQMCGPNVPTPPRFVSASERQKLLSGLENMPGVPGAMGGSSSGQQGGTAGGADVGVTTTSPTAAGMDTTNPTSTTTPPTTTSVSTTTSSTTTTSTTTTTSSSSTTSTTVPVSTSLPPPPPPPNRS